eukprot:3587326-Amphidinium_carterae.1
MLFLKTIVFGLVCLSWARLCVVCLRRSFEFVDRNRCHTFIARCAGGWPQPQLAGRAASTALVQRQREGPKMRGSRRLRSVPHVRIVSVPRGRA